MAIPKDHETHHSRRNSSREATRRKRRIAESKLPLIDIALQNGICPSPAYGPFFSAKAGTLSQRVSQAVPRQVEASSAAAYSTTDFRFATGLFATGC